MALPSLPRKVRNGLHLLPPLVRANPLRFSLTSRPPHGQSSERSTVRTYIRRQHRKLGGFLPAASRQSLAIAMNGAPLSVKRCFAFGYFVPVDSIAGTRQPLLLPNCRRSERKKPARLLGPSGGNLKVMAASSTASPAPGR